MSAGSTQPEARPPGTPQTLDQALALVRGGCAVQGGTVSGLVRAHVRADQVCNPAAWNASGDLQSQGLRLCGLSLDDVAARIGEVRSGLRVEDGRSVRFVAFRDRCRNLIWEAEHYCNKRDARHGITTDQPLKINDHLMDAWGMLAAHGLAYRRPPGRKDRGGYAVRHLKEKAERRRAKLGLDDGIRVG